jgi:hypothetical protein
MLPELHPNRSFVPVDADVCLNEPGDEHRRGTEMSRHRLELPQPAAGVDDRALLAARPGELRQCRRVRVPGDEDSDLSGEVTAQWRRLAGFQSAANLLRFVDEARAGGGGTNRPLGSGRN